MEAARTSETLLNFYQTTRRYNPEDSHLRTHRRENLKSYLILGSFTKIRLRILLNQQRTLYMKTLRRFCARKWLDEESVGYLGSFCCFGYHGCLGNAQAAAQPRGRILRDDVIIQTDRRQTHCPLNGSLTPDNWRIHKSQILTIASEHLRCAYISSLVYLWSGPPRERVRAPVQQLFRAPGGLILEFAHHSGSQIHKQRTHYRTLDLITFVGYSNIIKNKPCSTESGPPGPFRAQAICTRFPPLSSALSMMHPSLIAKINKFVGNITHHSVIGILNGT
jgi:hypothetical protein